MWARPVFIAKCARERWGTPTFKNVTPSLGGVTLCAPRAWARAVFGPYKCKDLCGHAQFLLRNVPEKDFETFELLS